ncbi:MAG TPA: SDR family oxidoreductase [Verrucomicrobiae bacterium]|nr:SDR family oxidoreductase [Verrucomicrobiae bacterium]
MEHRALVTGATTGIGFELADLLAADGAALVLVARDGPRLADRARELSQRHGVKCHVIVRDLARPAAAAEIFAETQHEGWEISILVNNAGFGVYGPFAETSLDEELRMMHVNMNAVVQLTKIYLPGMLARKEGRILNVASAASFQPGPGLNLYAATKAFVHSFTCALAVELAGTGVTATSLCPGGTATEFQKRAGMEHSRLFSGGILRPMSPRAVAQAGYRAMRQGRPFVVSGFLNKLMIMASRRLPVMWPAYLARKLNQDR